MSQHTPGPWIAIKGVDDDTERWGVYVDGPMRYHIATVENGAPGDTLETEEANACLLAASTEMLKALKACRALVEAYDGLNSDEFQRASAAITKAEGKEQP